MLSFTCGTGHQLVAMFSIIHGRQQALVYMSVGKAESARGGTIVGHVTL